LGGKNTPSAKRNKEINILAFYPSHLVTGKPLPYPIISSQAGVAMAKYSYLQHNI